MNDNLVNLDHLVIAASSLEQGVEYVRKVLGVDIPFGGVHTAMGTHNHLMQLGNSAFLEVIAINNEIAAPTQPRWYGLDDPFVHRQIAVEPCLLTWVVNTGNLQALIAQASFSLGQSVRVSRAELSWNFGLPSDGRLLGSGMLAHAIEWHSQSHPANNMADLGCHLQKLEIHHPYPQWLRDCLASIDALAIVDVYELPHGKLPFLTAYIDTPSGLKKLSTVL
jgi:hypothetical protein